MKKAGKKDAAKVATPVNLTLQRDEAVLPVARMLLGKLAAREDLMIGSSESIQADKAALYYQKVYVEDVIPLLIEHNLRLKDIPFLFSVMMQSIQLLNDVTTSSFEMNRDLADAKKYGLKSIDDLRVNDIDAALKAGVDNSGTQEAK